MPTCLQPDTCDPASCEGDQLEVIDFLSDPIAHEAAAVERITTHISHIFLAGDRAWKMKRALRTNYLDFSTLEKRELSCRREIEVNRSAPELYLGVTPVVRDGRHLKLGGPGKPVEWLVEMRRFDRSRQLDRLEEDGHLTLPIIEQLADAVADLHGAAPATTGFGDADEVRSRIHQISDALTNAAASTEVAAAAEAWRAGAQMRRRVHGALIDRRQKLGRVRRCHGDLHLGNIVMLADRPTPFDAIEFNEAIASIDVLYDLAFILIDLVARGRNNLANALVNRYLGTTRDFAGLPLMPLFMSMRAAVRAMTAAARGALGEASFYLALALKCLDASTSARLVAVGGISGSGKTTLARRLAPGLAWPLGAIVIRSDVVRKRLMQVPPDVRLPAEAYSGRRTRRVLARMAFDTRIALRAGLPVVLDATFLDRDARECAERLALAERVRFDGIWLEAEAEDASFRVAARESDASDATAEIVRRQAKRAVRPERWTVLQAARSIEKVAADAGRALY